MESIKTSNIGITYSVVIPVYNEVGNIRPLYERLRAVLEALNSPYEIIFVNDGSKDSSYDVLKEIALSDGYVKVISFTGNFGQHKAAVAGILEATGDYVITMDADLQNPPEEIPRLLKKMKEGFDMVSGCRKGRKGSLRRKFFSIIANTTISAVTGLKMKDYGSMLRVFKRSAAKALADEFMISEGYITMLIANVTHNVAEIEVSHDERYAGESKYNIRKLISVFMKIFRYHRMAHTPLGAIQGKQLFTIARKIENGKETIITSEDR